MQNKINTLQDNIWASTDLAISAFLAVEFELLDFRRVEGNRFEFVFTKSKKLESAIDAYFTNRAIVNPSDYFQKIKFLKSLLYSRN